MNSFFIFVFGIVVAVMVNIVTTLFNRKAGLQLLPWLLFYVFLHGMYVFFTTTEMGQNLVMTRQDWPSHIIVVLVALLAWSLITDGMSRLDQATRDEEPSEKPKKTEPSTDIPSLSPETQNEMVKRLRDVLSSFSEQLRVTVEPKTSASYSFAHTLAGIFKSAGWETVFRDPLKSGRGFQPNAMNRGIGIQGNNNELVKTVSGILEGAGCTKVGPVSCEIQNWTRGTPLPTLDLDQNAISIEVSYRQ